MGNDGGSIPDRRDLVKNKPKAEQADKANQIRALWLFCALSKVRSRSSLGLWNTALTELYSATTPRTGSVLCTRKTVQQRCSHRIPIE